MTASSGVEGLAIEKQPQGNSGSLKITTPKLTIEKGAEISVSNYGLANAGDIKINTSTLKLDSNGAIVANTTSGKGGSIDILAERLVILDQGSSISTTAAQNSNGGNITLETQNLALLNSNLITADARQGNRGNVFIDTQGLFVHPTSSITASSEVEQKQGNVTISTFELDSHLATGNIDRSPLVTQEQISSSCGVDIDPQSNQIRDLGRGGIPQNLLQATAFLELLNDWGMSNYSEFQTSAKLNQPPTSASQEREKSLSTENQSIVEMNSWKINSQGVVELVANTPQNRF